MTMMVMRLLMTLMMVRMLMSGQSTVRRWSTSIWRVLFVHR